MMPRLVNIIRSAGPKYTALRHDAVELQPVSHNRDEHAPETTDDWARLQTTAVIALSSVMEKLEEQLLPSVYPYVARSLQASPAALGYLTLSRALVQSIASPVGGVLGAHPLELMHRAAHRRRTGHSYNRVFIICVGCALWTAMTALFVGAAHVWQGCLLWAVNGVGLALVVPNCQSIVADDWYQRPVVCFPHVPA